jgi:hypothetical protein
MCRGGGRARRLREGRARRVDGAKQSQHTDLERVREALAESDERVSFEELRKELGL